MSNDVTHATGNEQQLERAVALLRYICESTGDRGPAVAIACERWDIATSYELRPQSCQHSIVTKIG